MKDKKKILVISNMYPSKKEKHYGIFVKNTEELLRENGYLVDKVIMTKHKNILIKLLSYILFHLKVIIKGLFIKYDYLYIHFVSHSSLGAIVVKKFKKNIKLVFNCHGNDVIYDLEEEKNNIKRSHKYLKYAYRVVVPSNFFKQLMIDEYHIPKEDIFVYPSGGVDTNKFIKKDQKECKKNCHLNLNKKYIGYVSRIEKNKGWDTFIKAIKELEKENIFKDLKFLIIGSGIEELEMKQMISDYKLDQYIEVRKMIHQNDLVNIYNSLDIFVFPSYRKESLGLVGIEAMSCETIVIGSNNYGLKDYLIDLENGFLFEPRNYLDLKNKIIKVLELDNEKKEYIKKNARLKALEYDKENIKNNILKVFE